MKCRMEISAISDLTFSMEKGKDYNCYETLKPEKTGKFIRELRKSMGLTQAEIADRLFVTRKAVSKWENGKCCPSVDIIKKICEFLGVTFDELIQGKFIPRVQNNEIENLTIVQKIMRNRVFKIFITTFIVICFLALFIFFKENYNSMRVYDIYYESSAVELKYGNIITTKAKTFMNLGTFHPYMDNVDENTKYDFLIYTKNDGKENPILKYKYTGQSFSLKENYNEINEKFINSELDNIYIKISYTDNLGVNRSLDINPTIELNYESNEKYNIDEPTSNVSIEPKEQSDKVRAIPESDVQAPCEQESESTISDETIDVSFLYDYTIDELYEKYNGKIVSDGTNEYSIEVNIEKLFLDISDSKKVICKIHFNNNNLTYTSANQVKKVYPINENKQIYKIDILSINLIIMYINLLKLV